jgi:hypothetical protein
MSIEKDLERQREDDEASKSRIDSAKDGLYQPGAPMVTRRQVDAGYEQRKRNTEDDTSGVWPPPVRQDFLSPEKKVAVNVEHKMNVVFRRLLIVAVAFFVLSLAAAGFMYFYGNNIISSRNINIEVTSPPSVPSSETFSFDVSVQNGNNSDLIKSAIIIDYPEGARSVDDNAKPLVSERIEIGTLGKGQVVKKTVSALLFGEENAEKNITVRFDYQVENSNGKFSKDKVFPVILRLAPIVLSVDALQEVNTNQEVVLTARVISNSNNTLKNIALNITYPFGFTYRESNIEVESGNRGNFPLGDLAPNETKTVEIKGVISGQSEEDKIFKFNVGTVELNSPEKVTTALAAYTHQMTVRGDFLASAIVFSGGVNYAVLGTALRGDISWRNTLKDPINDAEFSLKITGDLINVSEIYADNGFYDSNTSIIKWDKNTEDQLEEIAPGQTGSFSFTVPLFDYASAIEKRLVNPKINLAFDIKGQRVSEKNVTENIRSSFVKTVPVITTMTIDGYSLHDQGPLKNTGLIPPKAESKTTYTIALALSNSVNEVTAGELTAKLPNYVTYEGEVFPSSDKVSWNENTRLLRWNVNSIPPRTGYGSNPRTLYFKVSITPSRTQVGRILQLVNDINFIGKDAFANADINETSQDVTTATREDGNGFGNGVVVE